MCEQIRSYYDRVRSCVCVSVGDEGLEKVWGCGTRETEGKADRGLGCNNVGGGGNFGDLKFTRFSWSPPRLFLPSIVGRRQRPLPYICDICACACVRVCVCVHACMFV